jgi:hypothetical protein
MKTVRFRNPFKLADLDETLPPGEYHVEIDEEPLIGVSFTAYRRVNAIVHLPPAPAGRYQSRSVSIKPEDLDAALALDAKASGQT